MPPFDSKNSSPTEATKEALPFIVPFDEGAERLAGWYLLSTYLQRSLNLQLSIEPAPSGSLSSALTGRSGWLAYADALSLAEGTLHAGWLPVVRPVPYFEEVLLLARKGVQQTPHHPLRVAHGQDHWLLPDMGVELLQQQGLADVDWQLQALPSSGAALNALLDSDADLALLAVADWRTLRPAAQQAFYQVAESRSGSAFPGLCLSPSHAALRAPLLQAFERLAGEAMAPQLFADLGCQGFEPVSVGALEALLRRLNAQLVE